MKTYKDIYKFPLHKDKHGSWVRDSRSNFVFQFEPRFSKGDFAEGWKELESKALDAINDRCFFDKEVYLNEGSIFLKDDNSEPIITIRGWGNLTGIGGHNLPAEEAANIQDTFASYIVTQLNKRP